MRSLPLFLLLIPLFSTGCAPAPATPATASLMVQYTASSGAWLPALQTCAGTVPIEAELRLGDALDPKADLSIRIGQPADLTSPAFRIGNEDVLVVLNPQNPKHTLSADQVRGLFSGEIQNWKGVGGSDSPVEVWVYLEGDDVEQVFEQAMLDGSRVTSTARLASTPEEMSEGIAKDPNAVGVLARHWITGDVIEVYKAATAPILAITPATPERTTLTLLSCLQK